VPSVIAKVYIQFTDRRDAEMCLSMGSLFGVEITQRMCYQMSVSKLFTFLDGTPLGR
jgi:hypothetical protein